MSLALRKTKAQSLTRQETMRNFYFLQTLNIFQLIIHVFEQSWGNWNRCLELEQTPFVPSVQIHIDLGDFEDLGQLQCRAASTKLNLQTEAPTATVFWQKSFLGYFLRIFTAHCKSTFLLLLVTKHPNSCAVKALITPQAQWCGFHRLHCALCLSSRPRKAQVMNRNLEIKLIFWRKANA